MRTGVPTTRLQSICMCFWGVLGVMNIGRHPQGSGRSSAESTMEDASPRFEPASAASLMVVENDWDLSANPGEGGSKHRY